MGIETSFRPWQLWRGISIELQMHSVRVSPSLPSLTAMFLSVNWDLSHSLSINWSHFSSTEMALAHVCHVLWIPSGCSFSDFFYLFQAGNTWLKRPHFLIEFSRTRTPWVPLLIFDDSCSLSCTRSSCFFHLPLNLGTHSAFSLLTFCLLSVEVITLIESALISVYLMTWTGYDFFP